MNINISSDCMGCGACETLCPGAFELVDGQSSPKSPIDAAEDEVFDVADRCPRSAINVETRQEPREAPSLIEVLQQAEEAGVEGASEYLDGAADELGDNPRIEVQDEEPGQTEAKDESSGEREKGGIAVGAENRNRGRQLFIQVAIVAAIVLVSGYLTMS